jgi:mannose-6-phosphate isomerase
MTTSMPMIEFDTPERIDKPWGYELIWAKTGRYVGKILHIDAGKALSYQYHRVKDETVYLLTGSMEMELEEQGVHMVRHMKIGESLRIRAGTRHRMRALQDCEVLEASTAELDDVVRLEDLYGRA